MEAIVLYCKSYRQDVLRVKRLARSIEQFNVESIPFFISVPQLDLPLFREHLFGLKVTLFPDEDIIAANPKHDLKKINAMPGGLSQQVVKSEFWRLGICENYLCIDSDCEFLRAFRRSDFLAPDGTPYSVITEAKDFFVFCERFNLSKVPVEFKKMADEAQGLFERPGRRYGFGGLPVVWSKLVWKCFDEKMLVPRRQTFADMIEQFPYEMTLYGETLIRFRPIPLWPCEPFFKAYHYNTEYYFDQKNRVTTELISKHYLGVVWQSNWEGEHFGGSGKSFASRLLRKIKARIRKARV